ncbi:MAG: hypothetical protein H6737_01045 [Alphaproteobacteria bacterium]|nr:hypothetical protein [Alphaproteobacteria bacterium]
MSNEGGISTNTIIAGGVGLIVLMMCAGGGMSILTIGVMSLFSGGGEQRSGGVRIEPLTLGVQPSDDEIAHRKPGPLILPGQVSGPPTTVGAFGYEQCSDIIEGGPVNGPDCLTSEIRCDQQIIGHTRGGVDLYDTKFYEKKFCWPGTRDHDSGDERVYKLVMPPGEWRAWVDLHSPCADLDVAGIRFDHGGDRCPDISNTINQCEMKLNDNPGSERIELTSQTGPGQNAVWYIVVEGKNDDEGPFSLYVQCAPGLGGSLR